MKIAINFKGERFEAEAVRVSGLGKFFGLMFRSKNTKNLLFEFDKPVSLSIHSLFCPRFLAVWLDNDKAIDIKLVDNFKFNIKPAGKFTKLLELPVNSCNSKMINFLVGK